MYFENGKIYDPSDYKNISNIISIDKCVDRDSFIDLCELKKMYEPLKCIALETPYLHYLK
jgi:hypothetical protein